VLRMSSYLYNCRYVKLASPRAAMPSGIDAVGELSIEAGALSPAWAAPWGLKRSRLRPLQLEALGTEALLEVRQ